MAWKTSTAFTISEGQRSSAIPANTYCISFSLYFTLKLRIIPASNGFRCQVVFFGRSTILMLLYFPIKLSGCAVALSHETIIRSSHPDLFLGKGVLKICSKFTVKHPCQSAISIKLLCNFIEIALRHGCSPVNLLHIFRTPFPKNTSWWLLLYNTNRNNMSGA